MPKKSPLTDKQWKEVDALKNAGESYRSIAKKYKISDSTIRARYAQEDQAKAVAKQFVAAENSLNALPIKTKIAAHAFIEEMRVISSNLLGAAKNGAITANHLSKVASDKARTITTARIDLEELHEINTLTNISNNSAKTGIELIKVSKEAADRANKVDVKSMTTEQLQAIVDGKA